MTDFDFKNPDYASVFKTRCERLQALRKDSKLLASIKRYYQQNIADFISDWGVTYDPRREDSLIPFILFPVQRDWVSWVLERWRKKERGLTEKSRDMGLSWLAVAVACTICLFYENKTIGFGSRRVAEVDRTGDPDSLFYKARFFLEHLPPEFTGGWKRQHTSAHMRICVPLTDSSIIGGSGVQLGRGGRKSLYFVDEAAHLPSPELAEASLAATTDCRIDISTPFGSNNPFAERRRKGETPVFSFHWRNDLRRDEDWYKRQCKILDNPVIIAQELDLSYTASIDNIIIPYEWVQAALDAHKVLKYEPSGIKIIGYDVADEGRDVNAMCLRYGQVIQDVSSWRGKGSDLLESVTRVFRQCLVSGTRRVVYDADGLGAGVRGDARELNSRRAEHDQIEFSPFKSSGEVVNPTGWLDERVRGVGRKNVDFFENLKSQAWWSLRCRFLATYRAIVEKQDIDVADTISISSKIANCQQLMLELSQPVYKESKTGKIMVDKKPDGARSPNLADAVMMAFATTQIRRSAFFNV